MTKQTNEDRLQPDPYDPDNFWVDIRTNERVSKYTGQRVPMALSIPQLVEAKRIAFTCDDSWEHMLLVTTFAVENFCYQKLVRAFNYVAPPGLTDVVTIMWRDGRPEEMSFFWQNITRAEYDQCKEEQFRSYGGQFIMPKRQTYHGGLICRKSYTPIEWTVHT